MQQTRLKRLASWVIGWRFLAAAGAAAAAVAPAIMATEQGSELEGSISAYWDIDPSYYFWAPFTCAAILLIVDGFISMVAPSQRKYRNRWFNPVLGVALLLLTWFNKDDNASIHYSAATVFFVLFIVVIGYTAVLGWAGRHLDHGDDVGDERVERASSKVSAIFFGLLIITTALWLGGLLSFYFFEVFALLNFALFHIQGYLNPFPYHHYEFKVPWVNRIFRSIRVMR